MKCPNCGTEFVKKIGPGFFIVRGPPIKKRRLVAKCPGKIEGKDCGTMVQVYINERGEVIE